MLFSDRCTQVLVDVIARQQAHHCVDAFLGVSNEEDLGTPRSFFVADQPSRCLEINREISTIDVFPVNSNLTFPSDEK